MTQKVYISAYLPEAKEKQENYGNSVYNDLHQILGDRIVEIKYHSKNVWCRDYMPVKSATGKYVQFTYCPKYMKGMKKYAVMFPDSEVIHQELSLNCITPRFDIILDGGAIEICGKKGIVSDRVFQDNKSLPETKIYDEIKRILELEKLIVIPQHPYDFTGHVDGLVRFVDENSVVVNDLDEEMKCAENSKIPYRIKRIRKWVDSFKSSLAEVDLKMHELPVSYQQNGSDSSGEGIYINFLLLEDLIIMPVYGKELEDNEAAELVKELYGKTVKKVNAKELSQMGGMINCVTWTK